MDAVEALLPPLPARGARLASAGGGVGRVGGGSGKPAVLIDAFLAGVRSLGDATPSDHDLDVTKRYLALLTEQTAVDYLKSVDEMLTQVPNEFQSAVRSLSDAENFIFLAASGQVDKVTRAIDSNWDFVHIIDRDGHTALHAAASQGHVNVATLLLSRGANPSVQDYEGYTPLHWAVENNSPEMASLLLKSGADSSVRTNAGQTALDLVYSLKPKAQAQLLSLLQDSRATAAASTPMAMPGSPAARATDAAPGATSA